MEKMNLTKMFLFLVTILEQNMNNFLNVQWKPMCYGFNQECDNNIKRRYLRAQYYTILTKVVDKTTQARLL
jgi:hypothetical protein